MDGRRATGVPGRRRRRGRLAPFAGTWTFATHGRRPEAPARRRRRSRRRRRCSTPPAYDDFSEVVASWDAARGRAVLAAHAARSTCTPATTTRPTSACRREIDVTGQAAATLTFWTRSTSSRTGTTSSSRRAAAGTDKWTTLPDANGHTTQGDGRSPAADGAGWGEDLHARLLQLPDGRRAAPARRPARPASGTPPPARPAAGRSGTIDLSAVRGPDDRPRARPRHGLGRR